VSQLKVRLVALDIDGTLLRSDKTVSQRTRVAVARARAQGVRVVLVTGRRHPSAREVAAELGPGLPLVVHNGALVVEHGEVVRCRPLAHAVAARAIREGRARGFEPILHCGNRGEGFLVVDARAQPVGLLRYYLERGVSGLRRVDDVLEALPREEPIQVMFGGAIQDMADLHAALQVALGSDARLERTVYPATGFALADVLDPSVGKAEALAFLQHRWGITTHETLAIGDNWNDRAMLECAGRGLLMGNAPSELIALGLPLLPTNDEDGVAQAIESHVLAIQ
jgi:hydroxymethylpyrimidine pyrophosphatase-like HAD family hydrolase